MTMEVRRLLIVSDTLAGGLGALLRLQVEWFDANGWRVTVAAPTDGKIPEHATFHPVPLVGSARRVGEMRAARRALVALRSLGTHAVVHVHGMRSLLLARLAGLPTPFVSVHGAHPDQSDPPGYAQARRAWLAAVPRLAHRAVTGEPGYPPPWHYEIHASPLLRSLDVLPFPALDAVPTIGWLAGMDTRKQPEVFVRAIAGVATRGIAVHGLLGGTGVRLDEMRELVRSLAAPVDVLGQADARDVLARSHAFALFARSEGTPLAAMEAMWAGRSVVGSPVPGIELLVGDTGAIAGDVGAATDAIAAICTDLPAAAARGEAAAARVRTLTTEWAPWDTTEPHYLAYLAGR